jgi:aminocarboxymuconate-semialdehyde decarboxylase
VTETDPETDAETDVVIDTHSHWYPRSYAEALLRQADADADFARQRAYTVSQSQDLALPVNRLDARLAEMDEAGVDVTVLSLPPPATTFGAAATAAEMAARTNDELLEAAVSSGGRLRALISLPLPHVPESLAELHRVAGAAGLSGVQVLATGEHRDVAPDQAEPVLALCADLGLTVVLHPATDPLQDTYDDWALWATIGPVVSSSLAAARLVLGGLLDRVPALDLVVPHLGGVLPYLCQRLEDFGPGEAANPLGHYLRTRLFYDTCSYHQPALRCAVETCGADRFVLGTDYPVRGPLRRGVEDIRAFFTGEVERAAVLGGVAAKLFPQR